MNGLTDEEKMPNARWDATSDPQLRKSSARDFPVCIDSSRLNVEFPSAHTCPTLTDLDGD